MMRGNSGTGNREQETAMQRYLINFCLLPFLHKTCSQLKSSIQRSVVSGQWSAVSGQRSAVSGQWSAVGQWPLKYRGTGF
ncbi:hypothetical protein BI334_30435 [Moorena producens 3L]|nr:hypothetical protein BI334_30435 [Moorena producens 3L]